MRLIQYSFIFITAFIGKGLAQWSVKQGEPDFPDHAYVQPFSEDEWQNSDFASEDELQWFRDAKYGMFIHFGLSALHNAELSWGMVKEIKPPDKGRGRFPIGEWSKFPEQFRLEKFNADDWASFAKNAGFKYMVVIAKHHDGFHLWDTKQSEFKITNTPFGRDYLKELATAARKKGLKFGIYYSQRDWYHPDYFPVDYSKWKKGGPETDQAKRHQKYIDYQMKVVRELCTNYGKIDIFWWDAYMGENKMFTPEMWDAQRLSRMIRQLQPEIIINNRNSLPGDFDTPEQLGGFYREKRPWESAICLTRTWCYSATPPKPASQIIEMISRNNCQNGNVLLSWGPKWNGEFAQNEQQRLLEVGAWLERNGRAHYGTRGGPWKPTTWGGSTRRDKSAFIHVLKWPSESISLPSIAGRKVVAASLLSGTKIDFQESATAITFSVPVKCRDPHNTIIELIFDATLDDIPPISAGSGGRLLDDSAIYGGIISNQAVVTASSCYKGGVLFDAGLTQEEAPKDFAVHTAPEMNPWILLDLKSVKNVTGIRIFNRDGAGQSGIDRADGLKVSVSVDGQKWEEVWKAASPQTSWEFAITSVTAGAKIPGKLVRFVRFELNNSAAIPLHLKQVQVFGK